MKFTFKKPLNPQDLKSGDLLKNLYTDKFILVLGITPCQAHQLNCHVIRFFDFRVHEIRTADFPADEFYYWDLFKVDDP